MMGEKQINAMIINEKDHVIMTTERADALLQGYRRLSHTDSPGGYPKVS